MKTVKNITNNNIERVTDKLGRERTKTSTWKYISKSEWKKEIRDK